MESKIIIRNIDVYDDVTMAQVLLQAEGQEKKLKCLWRTARIRSKSTGNRIPRGTFPLQFKPRAGYLPALVLKVSVQCFIGIVPYKHVTWENFGNDIYLLNYDESILSEDDYKRIVRTMLNVNAKTVEIKESLHDNEYLGENFLVKEDKVIW
jgi:hypothetical protein